MKSEELSDTDRMQLADRLIGGPSDFNDSVARSVGAEASDLPDLVADYAFACKHCGWWWSRDHGGAHDGESCDECRNALFGESDDED